MNEDKATRYNRLKRNVGVASVAWSTLLLAGVAVTGVAVSLRTLAERAGGPADPAHGASLLSVATFVALLFLMNELGAVPLAFYGGFVLERRYGLARHSAGEWALDQLKALAVGLALAAPAACVLYTLINWTPAGWWLPGAVAFGLAAVGLANIGPLLLLPLFYAVRPLRREELRARLVGLATRAGARVLDAYEWGLGEKTTRANAALTGIGSSRRILVSDTMLEQYSDDEIEVVLAHELAHHVHGDIWKGLVLEGALIFLGFRVASWALETAVPWLGLRGVGDVAGLPVLLLAAGAVSLVLMPVMHAVSRAHERQADAFALRLTGNPSAFVSAMRRLAAQNLADEDPSVLVQYLFHSHPPIRERIAAAQAFRG
jgi:STE24 endopeptidase